MVIFKFAIGIITLYPAPEHDMLYLATISSTLPSLDKARRLVGIIYSMIKSKTEYRPYQKDSVS